MDQQTNKTPSVIPRSDIPVSPDGNLEVQPFLAHKVLGSVLPQSPVALAWTRAQAGRDVALRSHPTPGLLVILEGRATLIGGLNRKVEAGDVITLPCNLEYGFAAVGPAGLHALHVAFEADSDSYTDEALSVHQLLDRNQMRLQTTLNNSFFLLLRRRGIDSERKRLAMRETLRVFSDAFQTLLFTRQAMCRDDEYAPQFSEHLREEIGHNLLLSTSGTSRIAKDPVLRAMSSWFCNRMLLLDNSEKAVVTLVLETGAFYVCSLSRPLFEGDEAQGYFETHAEEDLHHQEMSAALLTGLHPQVYRRLHGVLDETWDMVDAMTQRFAHLIGIEATTS